MRWVGAGYIKVRRETEVKSLGVGWEEYWDKGQFE